VHLPQFDWRGNTSHLPIKYTPAKCFSVASTHCPQLAKRFRPRLMTPPDIHRNQQGCERFNRHVPSTHSLGSPRWNAINSVQGFAQHARDRTMLQPMNNKVTAACPSGHKLRGKPSLVGKTVKCPRCEAEFVFALTFKPSTSAEAKEVTDTGVMRILGTMESVPPPPKRRVKTDRPCTRCGTSVPENTTVCSNCNCYVGVLPTFLKEMSPSASHVK
jgi:hypothetical protein